MTRIFIATGSAPLPTRKLYELFTYLLHILLLPIPKLSWYILATILSYQESVTNLVLVQRQNARLWLDAHQIGAHDAVADSRIVPRIRIRRHQSYVVGPTNGGG